VTTTAVKERPILFSGPMVRAILAERKTQTRRVVKLDAELKARGCTSLEGAWVDPGFGDGQYLHVPGPNETFHRLHSPIGFKGERLWVREAFWSKHDTDMGDYGVVTANMDCLHLGKEFHPGWDFVATPECQDPPKERGGRFTPHDSVEPGDWWFGPPDDWDGTEKDHEARGRWLFLPWEKDFYTKHPSIHMPRWMCRLELEIVNVRVERLQQISEADAKAEGVEFDGQWWRGGVHPVKGSAQCWPTATRAFEALWGSVNAARGFGWEKNPWVWVIEFRRAQA
jgi:hypothetical protein